MRISLAFGSLRPRDRSAARACLTINLLGLPGLGTWVAGRPVGIFQMTLALAGFGLTGFWFVLFLVARSRTGEFPWNGGTHLVWGIAGALLFAAAWSWSLATSLQIVRQNSGSGL